MITCGESNQNCTFTNKKLATNLIVTTVEKYVKNSATTLRIAKPKRVINGISTDIAIPCSGYIQFGECCCNSEDFEIASYNGVDDSVDGEYKLLNMVRNLALTGSSETSVGIPQDHPNSVKIAIGGANIHYYLQSVSDALCGYITTNRTIYSSISQLPTATGNGQFAIVQTGGSFRMYADLKVNNIPLWVGQNIAINDAAPGIAGLTKLLIGTNTTVYNRGATVLDTWYDNTILCGVNDDYLSTAKGAIYSKGSTSKIEYYTHIGIPQITTSLTIATTLVSTNTITLTSKYACELEIYILRSKADSVLNYELKIYDGNNTLIQTIPFIGASTEEEIRDILVTNVLPSSNGFRFDLYAINQTNLVSGTIDIKEIKIKAHYQPTC